MKCFIRFVLAQAAVTYCMDLMTAIFTIAQGAISSIIGASGLSAVTEAALPESMVSAIENVGFFESIPLWAVTLLGSLFIWAMSLILMLRWEITFFLHPERFSPVTNGYLHCKNCSEKLCTHKRQLGRLWKEIERHTAKRLKRLKG